MKIYKKYIVEDANVKLSIINNDKNHIKEILIRNKCWA